MKKIFSFLTIITLITPVYADKLLKDGFLNNKMDYAKEQNIVDAKNKIILIYNHGQDRHDESSKNCVWKNGRRSSYLYTCCKNLKDFFFSLRCIILHVCILYYNRLSC